MKRLLLAIAIIIATAVSCQIESLDKGLYTANTKDGTLYLELKGNHECVMFFDGNEKKDCSYWISDGEIDLIANAVIKVNGRTVSWWFGGSLGKGKIYGDSFTIQSQRMYASDAVEYIDIYFHKN